MQDCGLRRGLSCGAEHDAAGIDSSVISPELDGQPVAARQETCRWKSRRQEEERRPISFSQDIEDDRAVTGVVQEPARMDDDPFGIDEPEIHCISCEPDVTRCAGWRAKSS